MDKLLDWKIPNNLSKSLDSYNGKIITRFAPEPSGYLHIGHMKALFINYIIAKKYGGEIILRIDDTNPMTESREYELAIIEDVKKLINPDRITHTSNYFEQLLKFADILVSKDLAYVEEADSQTISQERKDRIPSKNREIKPQTNKEYWEQMKNGQKRVCSLRIKMDPLNANGALRDPIIYRFVENNLYPTYDFACPIVDSLENITHVFRSSEFADRDDQYLNILKLLELNTIILSSFGKINIQDEILSKRKIKQLIETRLIEGWDDPRVLTLRGAMRKGLTISGLWDYIQKMGFSKNVINSSATALWSLNLKHVDKRATRYTAIPIHEVCYGYLSHEHQRWLNETKRIAKFHKNPSLGDRELKLFQSIIMDQKEASKIEIGEEITFINWCNGILTNRDQNKLNFQINPQGHFKSTEKKILWIGNDLLDPPIPIKILEYGTNFSIYEKYLSGEPDMKNIRKGEFVQILRMEYYICEKEYDVKLNNPLILIKI